MLEPKVSPVYPRAPIIESVIELRMRGEIGVRDVEKIATRLGKRYEFSELQNVVDVGVIATGSGVTLHQQARGGRRLFSSDQANVAIVNQRSLVTACLPPYQGWNAFCADARKNFQDWKKVDKSFAIERIGVRYVNRIDIPSGVQDLVQLEKYFTIYPGMSTYERPLLGFLVQATVNGHLTDWAATITVAPFEPALVPDHVSILLDIDAYRTSNIPHKDEDLWRVVTEGQAIKNDLFERTLTPAAKRLFSK